MYNCFLYVYTDVCLYFCVYVYIYIYIYRSFDWNLKFMEFISDGFREIMNLDGTHTHVYIYIYVYRYILVSFHIAV